MLSRRAALIGVAYAFAVTMIGTTLPTPLYPIYERQIHFSDLTVTLVFAAYGLFAAAVREHVISRPRVLRWMRRTFAGAFVALGAKLAATSR